VKVAETLLLATEQPSVITNINGQPPYDDCCNSIVTCIVLLPLKDTKGTLCVERTRGLCRFRKCRIHYTRIFLRPQH